MIKRFVDEDGIVRIGRWMFLLHDEGWTLARDQVVRLDARWPTYLTFKWRTGHGRDR